MKVYCIFYSLNWKKIVSLNPLGNCNVTKRLPPNDITVSAGTFETVIICN